MNANTVLNKIVALLSKEEVKMTYAKLADGTIVESATFDVGEPIEVVTEDGKTPAPDGEHELFLRDEEGNEVRIRVIVKDGIITERENVEELEDAETIKVDEEKQKEMNLEEELPMEESEEESEEVTINLEDVAKVVEEMSYRIEELEKKLAGMQVEDEEVKEEETMEEEEEDLPKLDGAPVEASKVFTPNKKNANKIKNRQSAFLSKLYN